MQITSKIFEVFAVGYSIVSWKKGSNTGMFVFTNKQQTNKEPQMTSTKYNYAGKKVYVGIDVHKKTYTFSAVCNGEVVKTATVPAIPESFIKSLKKWFDGAKLHSVYEAGFSGYSLHRALANCDIKNIVINPASLEIAAKDKVKTDKRDSKKLAAQLSDGRLVGIYVPTEKEEQARLITRTREQIVEDRTRVAARIKSRMHFFGLIDHDDTRVISEPFLTELEASTLPDDTKRSFAILISHWRFLTNQLEEIKNDMMAQSFEDSENEAIYRSVPGVGIVSARTLSNELGDLSKRFRNQNSLYQFIGLTPVEFSSGESVRKGNISRQGSARIRKILVEVSWRAIREDEALKEAFYRISATRGAKRAIVAIARKLIGRIRACFVNRCEYAVGLVA
jgi:transposase